MTTMFADAIEVVSTVDLTREDWLTIRKTGIGGSDAAAIAGLNKWRSPFETYLDKVGAPELEEDRGIGEAAQWGNLLEPVVADEVKRRTGFDLFPVNSVLAHPDRRWQLANIDRGLTADGELALLEIKTGSVYTAEGWADDEVPDAYIIQGQHYLSVTGLPWMLYGVLIGGQRLEIRRVDRDPDLIDNLIALEARFWEQVTNRTPPPPDGSKACTELLATLYDVKADSVRTISDDADLDTIAGLIGERNGASADKKAAAKIEDECSNRLKVFAGDHEIVTDGEGRVLFSWKTMPAQEIAATTRKAHRRLHVPKGTVRG